MFTNGPPSCSSIKKSYCENKKVKMDATCHDVKHKAGDMILFEIDDRTCYCICSCLGTGTRITTPDGGSVPVEKIESNRTEILAAGKNLKFEPKVVEIVSHSLSGKIQNAIYLRYSVEGTTIESVVTMSHPYLLHDGTLVSAECLELASELVDRHGNRVAIESLAWGSYDGTFWEISTEDKVPDANLDGHLVLTNGVVAGDFAVEQWVKYKRPTPDGRMPEKPPIIGSPAWLKANHYVQPPADAEPIRKVGGGYFTPASHHRVAVPAHASDFLPTTEAAYLEEHAPKREFNSPLAHQMCDWLLNKVFRPTFADDRITFLFDWCSEDVNTHSWVDDDGKKYVLLCGGLSRIKGFDYDGVALALAHEVGHLLGKPDIDKSHVTCEGEADWYASSAVLRQIWFGQEYFDKLKRAIEQVEILYSYLGDAPPPAIDKSGRPYPNHECRLKTFRTAMKSVDQPACSKCRLEER